jgi:hypothetical protein
MARTIGTVNQASLESSMVTTEKQFFNMTLKDMPVASRTKFKRLKAEGKVTGSFNAYLRQAVIDKLNKDDV